MLYTVKSGDSLRAIAQRLTGDAGHYAALAAANGIAPDLIRVGQQLEIPDELLRLQVVGGEPLPVVEHASPVSFTAPAVYTGVPPGNALVPAPAPGAAPSVFGLSPQTLLIVGLMLLAGVAVFYRVQDGGSDGED